MAAADVSGRVTPATQPYDLPSPPPSLQVDPTTSVAVAAISPSVSPQDVFQKRSDPYPTIERRRYPPLRGCDTCFYIDGEWVSVRPTGIDFYRKEEIYRLYPSRGEVNLGSGIIADKTELGIVIQQQANRACGAAAAAMLVLDATDSVESLDTQLLRSINVTSEDMIKHLISTADLIPLSRTIGKKDLSALRAMIQEDGSAIVTTNNYIKGHSIIVDDISEDLRFVKLRDPYHGWGIMVPFEAFLDGFSEKNEIIQIKNIST